MLCFCLDKRDSAEAADNKEKSPQHPFCLDLSVETNKKKNKSPRRGPTSKVQVQMNPMLVPNVGSNYH